MQKPLILSFKKFLLEHKRFPLCLLYVTRAPAYLKLFLMPIVLRVVCCNGKTMNQVSYLGVITFVDLVLTNNRHRVVTQALFHFLNELQPPAATTIPIPLLPYVLVFPLSSN